ncbi:hypothetical protein [Streptomyces sp. KLOTTS4A1]
MSSPESAAHPRFAEALTDLGRADHAVIRAAAGGALVDVREK